MSTIDNSKASGHKKKIVYDSEVHTIRGKRLSTRHMIESVRDCSRNHNYSYCLKQQPSFECLITPIPVDGTSAKPKGNWMILFIDVLLKLKTIANRISSWYKNKNEKIQFLSEIDSLIEHLGDQKHQINKYKSKAKSYKRKFEQLLIESHTLSDEVA